MSRRLLRAPIQDAFQRRRTLPSRRRNMAASGDTLTLRLVPMTTIEEASWPQRGSINLVQAACVHGNLVRLRARHVERVHAAMSAEGMLRYPGLESVDRQRSPAPQQFK